MSLLLNRNPNGVDAAVEQRGFQQPRALRVAAQGFRVHVEVPLGSGEPELISGRRRISWRCVDRGFAIGRIAVLDGLERVDAGC